MTFRYFFRVLAFYVLLWGIRTLYLFWLSWNGAVYMGPKEEVYYHYQRIPILLETRDWKLRRAWRTSPPQVVIHRNGKPVATIGKLKILQLSWRESEDAWVAEWPCPWSAPEGMYVPSLMGAEELGDRLKIKSFRVAYRKPSPLPPRFVALTYENMNPYASLKVMAPDGQVKNWTGLLDWVEYLGADAFWVLAGETPGDRGKIWMDYNFSMLPKIGKECHRRGIKFGVWVMSYMTLPGAARLPRYEYAVDIESDTLKVTRSISIRDPHRPGDIADLLKTFRDIPEVDYLGLDYIRNALGGYELAEDFLKEMPWVEPPEGWKSLSAKEKIRAFVRKKIARKDRAFIDAWQWWRAHRVGQIVSEIKQAVGSQKSLWAFTLGWERGWQHGQDPIMMNDAGIDVDTVMMYEATGDQFNDMILSWSQYLKSHQAQVMVGNVIDWPLHQQMDLNEFKRRFRAGMQGIYGDGPAKGIFVHDLSRALWGRKGPYSTLQWMEAAKEVIQEFKSAKSAALSMSP
ncbi:MAG: hypothetical protein HY400_00590 [Elusimicrobia bacterium]|nr:hypothetical protein [Elusimicrobiota bacterium]